MLESDSDDDPDMPALFTPPASDIGELNSSPATDTDPLEDDDELGGAFWMPTSVECDDERMFGPKLPDDFWLPQPVTLPSGHGSSSKQEFDDSAGLSEFEVTEIQCRCKEQCWQKLAAHEELLWTAQQELATSSKAESDKKLFVAVGEAKNGVAAKRYNLCGE